MCICWQKKCFRFLWRRKLIEFDHFFDREKLLRHSNWSLSLTERDSIERFVARMTDQCDLIGPKPIRFSVSNRFRSVTDELSFYFKFTAREHKRKTMNNLCDFNRVWQRIEKKSHAFFLVDRKSEERNKNCANSEGQCAVPIEWRKQSGKKTVRHELALVGRMEFVRFGPCIRARDICDRGNITPHRYRPLQSER